MITEIAVVDTETSDTDPEAGAGLLEVAALSLLRTEDEGDAAAPWTLGEHWSLFVEWEGPVSPEARAVHHIRPEKHAVGALGCRRREDVLARMLDSEHDGLVWAAHNAPFDRGFLPELTRPWIDTLQCSRHIWPDAPRHGNQVLRYWLGVEPRADLVEGLEAHRALYDIACTAELLLLMLQEHSVEELLRLSTTPLLLQKCHLKKYKDVPWAEVPRDYLRWITTTDMLDGKDNVNLRHTVHHYLGLR